MLTRHDRRGKRLPKKKSGTRGSPSGRLRIVAGKWRSRLLPVADLAGLRPTSERVRETLFNWLAPVIEGARCLDLFAGTGALGFEALSRGARSVTFVEQSIIQYFLVNSTGRNKHKLLNTRFSSGFN